jgi:hypothetical protein
MATLTLRWRDEVLDSELTDLEAAAACERIPADHKSRAYTQTLISDLRRYGSLFDGKRFWLHEHAARQLDRERAAASPEAVESAATATGYLPRIAAFLTPVSDRLKSGARVTFTSGPLTVTIARAGADGRHPGSFYVRGLTGFGETGSVYAGRISPEGHFFPSRDCDTSVLALLDEFEQGPADYALAYGQRSGRCFACDAKLDDPISIGIGVGPVCAKHYRIPWGKRALAAAVKLRCEKPAAT